MFLLYFRYIFFAASIIFRETFPVNENRLALDKSARGGYNKPNSIMSNTLFEPAQPKEPFAGFMAPGPKRTDLSAS